MSGRWRRIGMLGVALLAAMPAVAAAQRPLVPEVSPEDRSRSHAPLPAVEGAPDPAVSFDEHLRQAQQGAEAEKIYRDVLKNPSQYLKPDNRAALRSLAEAVKDGSLRLDPNDPLMGELKKILEGGPGQRSQIEALLPPEVREMVEEYRRGKQAGGDGPGAGTEPAPGAPSHRRAARETAPEPPPEGSNEVGAAARARTAPDRAEGIARSPLGQWLARQAENVAVREGLLRNSGAFRRAVEELRRYQPGSAGRAGASWEDRAGRDIARWMEQSMPRGFLSESFWERFNGIKLPDVDLSRMHSGSPQPDGAGAAPAGRISPGDAGTALVAIVGVGILATVLWVLLSRYGPEGARAFLSGKKARAAGSWTPGPWPVAPGEVASRQDLVRAFEYLSLRELGPGARHWSHRTIAARLAGARADRRRAVADLAGLYEKARYAPATDPLPEGAIELARRDLKLLAGTSAP